MPKGRVYVTKEVPDGGWGWVVVVASFMIQVITNGTTLTFGIVFVELLRYFHSNQSNTAWVGSIQAFFMYASGFLCTPFLHRFGHRGVTIVAAILATIGFATSALATNIYILYVTYGLLTGVGNGVMYMVSIVTVQQYFNKKRGVANGITMTGSGVGIVVFGISTPFLVTTISWQYMLYCNAAVTAVVGVVGGAMYRPLPDKLVTLPRDQTQTNIGGEQGTKNTEKSERDEGKDAADRSGSDGLDDGSTDQYGTDLTISIQEERVFSHSDMSDDDFEIVERITVRKSVPIFSIVPELIDDSGLFDFEFLEFPLAVESQVPQKTRTHYQAVSHVYQFFSICREMFDLKLLKSASFDLFTFAILMFTYGSYVPYSFVPEWAIWLGAPYQVASLMIPIIGFSSIFSRLGFGFLMDKFQRQRFDINGCLLASLCILCLISAGFLNYQSLILYCAVFGFINGGIYTVYPVVLMDLVGRDQFDKALGLVLAITSLAPLTTGPISGLIIDELGNLQEVVIPFVTVGGAQILGLVAYFSIHLVNKCNSNTKSKLNGQGEADHLLQD